MIKDEEKNSKLIAEKKEYHEQLKRNFLNLKALIF